MKSMNVAFDARGPELAAIASRARDGDVAAFRLLVERTTAALFRVALRTLDDRAEAEDIVQDSYAKAWQSMGTLREPGAVLGWLARITQNLARDRLRSRKVRPTTSLDDDERDTIAARLCSADPGADDVASDKQTSQFVHEVLSTLKDKHRVVLLLKEVDGMTAEEIGALLQIPTGTVESRLVRARGILGKKIQARGKKGWFS